MRLVAESVAENLSLGKAGTCPVEVAYSLVFSGCIMKARNFFACSGYFVFE